MEATSSFSVLMMKMCAKVIISALAIDNLNGKTYFLELIFLVVSKAAVSNIIEQTKNNVKRLINKNL